MRYHAERCLIIPDVHQAITWADRVLAKEASSASATPPDLIVFLGDYFDSHRSEKDRATIAATCEWLDATSKRFAERAIFLLGNHDVQYLEARASCLRHRTPRHLRYKCGSAFSHSAAKRTAKTLSPEFWSATRLFVTVNDWLLSHAGLATAHWPRRESLDESLAALELMGITAKQSILAPVAPHPLLQAGAVRGGDALTGGVTWLDWDDEFADAPALPPQIVGHTGDPHGARRNGRSHCLDGMQTCYGVLTKSTFEVYTA